MNQLNSFAEKFGFKTDKLQAWGAYKGYQFTIGRYSRDNVLSIFTAVCFAKPEDESSLSSVLSGMTAAKLIKDYKNSNGSVSITKTKAIGQVSSEELEYLLDKLTDHLASTGARPACFNCRKDGSMEYASYNGIVLPICDTCYDSIAANLNAARMEHEGRSSNYTSGVSGAVLGALLGSVLWIVIGLLGYIASIAGFAISAASARGYTMLNGKITRATPWIIGLASLFALILAQFLTLDIVFYRELNRSGIDISVPQVLKSTFSLPFIDPDVTAGFIKDSALGLLFAALGAYSTFKRLAVTAKAPAGSLERV